MAWQEDALQKLTALLCGREEVCGLGVIGSCSDPDTPLDDWSDLDLVVLVKDLAIEEFLKGGWLTEIGELFCQSRSTGASCSTLRAYFTNGRRIDCVFVSESSVGESWAPSFLAGKARCLWSRDPFFEHKLLYGQPAPRVRSIADTELCQMLEEFRFKAMLAANKVARNDLLVATHLALDLMRDCCVLAMLLRDKETGCDHHRSGQGLWPLPEAQHGTVGPFDAEGVLSIIQKSAHAIEELAGRLAYSERSGNRPLFTYVEHVRRSLQC